MSWWYTVLIKILANSKCQTDVTAASCFIQSHSLDAHIQNVQFIRMNFFHGQRDNINVMSLLIVSIFRVKLSAQLICIEIYQITVKIKEKNEKVTHYRLAVCVCTVRTSKLRKENILWVLCQAKCKQRAKQLF